MPQQNAASELARQQEEEKQAARELGQYLHDITPQIARALPRGLDPDRIARLALTAARRTPKLLKTSRESFAGALMTAVALGLEPDVGGQAYLVPYGPECQLIVGYQGLIDLYYQHPLAGDVYAKTVYDGDYFDWAWGTQKYIKHRPAPTKERGEPTHYYAVATLRNGATPFEVLTADEVKDLRGGKVGPDPKFKGGDPMRWMERKTVLRQLFKATPKSPRLQLALERDERPGTELYRELRDNPAVLTVAATPPASVDTTTGEITDPPQVEELPYTDDQEPPSWR